jgi:hypothetical protein
MHTSQTARRWTRIALPTFSISDDRGRREWQTLLKTYENDLVLADGHRGMLGRDLSKYVFNRTGGNIGSATTLIQRGCYRAIRTGREVLDRETLDEVAIDAAAESQRSSKAPAKRGQKVTVRTANFGRVA